MWILPLFLILLYFFHFSRIWGSLLIKYNNFKTILPKSIHFFLYYFLISLILSLKISFIFKLKIRWLYNSFLWFWNLTCNLALLIKWNFFWKINFLFWVLPARFSFAWFLIYGCRIEWITSFPIFNWRRRKSRSFFSWLNIWFRKDIFYFLELLLYLFDLLFRAWILNNQWFMIGLLGSLVNIETMNFIRTIMTSQWLNYMLLSILIFLRSHNINYISVVK